MKCAVRCFLTAALAAITVALTPQSTLSAQPLFRSDTPVEITLTANMRELLRERDSTALRWFPTEMRYTDDSGETVVLPVELRARGHFRRQARNCSFPPIMLRAQRSVRDGTLLQGNPRLKIVTPCRPNQSDYQQYILLEYLAYRTYQAIHPVHHRTRLARITYADSTDREQPLTVTAFFLEIEEEVADEHELELFEQMGARWTDLEAEELDRLSLFQYWIGNTDWSVSGLHNISLFGSGNGLYLPVAYDFDWTGLVSARYSFPNATLGIRTVRDRLHRGACRTAAEWAPTVQHFLSRKSAVDSVWASPVPGLTDRQRNAAKSYLDQLWPILQDERRFRREIIEVCQPSGN